MTGALRQYLRGEINKRTRTVLEVRRQLEIECGIVSGRQCRGCGGDIENVTSGCKVCDDRDRSRARRNNAAYREHDRQRRQAERQRKREALYRKSAGSHARSCGTCGAYIFGRCRMFGWDKVGKSMVCDKWYKQ